MEDYDPAIKFRTNKSVCEKHHMYARINIVDGKAVLICCCLEFKLICYKEIIAALNDYKANRMKVVWKRPDCISE